MVSPLLKKVWFVLIVVVFLSGMASNKYLLAKAPPVSLQISACSSLTSAQTEVRRLVKHGLRGKVARISLVNQAWFIVYIDRFKNREEAKAFGKRLIADHTIKDFLIISQPLKELTLPTPKKNFSPPPAKETTPLPEKGVDLFGPVTLSEKDNLLRISLPLEKRWLPQVRSEKGAKGSSLFLTFKNVGRPVLPIEINRQGGMLLSFSISSSGLDSHIVFVLSSEFNYDLAQDYYEKEKLFILTITKVPLGG